MMSIEKISCLNLIWLLLLIVVAVFDFKYRKVKNLTNIFGAITLLFFMYFGALSFMNLIFGGFVFLVFLIFYKLNLVAAGDVKFSFLIGSFFGFSFLVVIVFVLANIFSLMHGLLFVFRDKFEFIKYRFFSSKENLLFFKKIPYAGYLSISAILCMLYMPKP